MCKKQKNLITSTCSETANPPKSITCLPHEIIIHILNYCVPHDVFEVRQTNSFFFNACKDIPLLYPKVFLQRIYNGDLDIITQLHMRPYSPIDSQLLTALTSEPFRSFRATNALDSANCGRHLLLLAICHEFGIDLVPNMYLDNDMVDEIREEPELSRILYFGSADVFSLVTPTLTINERFSYSLHHRGPAVELLNQILDTGETRVLYENLKETLEDQSGAETILHLLFQMNFALDDDNLESKYVSKYVSKCCWTKIFPLVLLDAVTSGHMDLNCHFQQIVCWICISSSLAVLKKLLSHPTVDPGRWNNFALYCHIQHRDIQSLTEILKDPRVDPMLYYDDILKLDWYGQGVELCKALFANPNFHRDYDDRRLLKKAITMPTLLKFLMFDPKVNLGINNNELLFLAIQTSEDESVEIMLSDERIDLTGSIDRLIHEAFSTKDQEMLSTILKHPRINCSTFGPTLLKGMIRSGYTLATSDLLDRLQTDPSINIPDLFLWFAKQESPQPDILNVFLRKPGLDPSVNNNEAFRYLLSKIYPAVDIEKDFFGFTEPHGGDNLLKTAQLLSQDKRVKKKWIEMQLASLDG